MTYYVNMTDKFMSGWGRADGLINKYCIECDTYEQALTIERNAHQREEMKHINICMNRPANKAGYIFTHKHFSELGDIWTK